MSLREQDRLPKHQSEVKNTNKRAILRALWEHSPVSRTDLARMTGLNKATITNLIREIEQEGMVQEIGSQNNGVGRALNLIMFHEGCGLSAAVCIEEQAAVVVIGNVFAKPLWKQEIAFAPGERHVEILDRINAAIQEGLECNRNVSEHLLGIAISMPCHPPHKAAAQQSINWEGVAVDDFIRHRYDAPVFVDTVPGNALLAECWFGSAKGRSHVVYINVDNHIQFGMLLNGRPYVGASGRAGNVAHVPIDPNGPRCSCGKRGCWERLASGSALQGFSIADAVERAKAGDVECIKALDNIGRNLGLGIGRYVQAIDPELVVLGGEMVQADKWVMNPCRNALNSVLDPAMQKTCMVRLSTLGTESLVLGTLTRAIVHLFE